MASSTRPVLASNLQSRTVDRSSKSFACWLLAVHKRSAVLGAVSSVIGWCSLLMSLAFLPIGLIAVLCGFAAARSSTSADDEGATGVAEVLQTLQRPVVGGVAAFLILTVGLAFLTDVNLGRVWLLNYQNHAAFYSQFERTWWKWLLVNPVELSFACGVPVAMLAAAVVWRVVLRGPGSAIRWQSMSVVFVWGLLWLSGKNSGEAARLWIPLLPVFVWQLAAWFHRSTDSPVHSISLRNTADRNWLILLALQMTVCSLTVLRVTGFHFNVGTPLP